MASDASTREDFVKFTSVVRAFPQLLAFRRYTEPSGRMVPSAEGALPHWHV
jgi:hypothetical protein